MGTDKRERQKANRAAKLEAERTAEAKARRMRTIRNLVILAVVVIVVVLVSTACSSSDSDGENAYDKDGAKTSTTAATDGPSTATKASYGTGECAPADGVDEPVLTFDDAPKQCIDPAKTYTATIETSEGTIVLDLDTERAPVTVNNFVNLARSGYFDGTVLFRTEKESGIIQGGSPHTQDNTDQGPGYTIPDEGGPYTSDDYAPGTIAMANTGQPNSGSAQFFFLANEGGRYLGDASAIGPSAGSYTVFGTATEGADVLKAISALDDGSSTPSKTVTIDTVTITES